MYCEALPSAPEGAESLKRGSLYRLLQSKTKIRAGVFGNVRAHGVLTERALAGCWNEALV